MLRVVTQKYDIISSQIKTEISSDTFIELAEKFKIALDNFLERTTYLTIVDVDTGEIYALDEVAEIELLKGTQIDKKRKKIPSISAIDKYYKNEKKNKEDVSLFKKFSDELRGHHVKEIQQAYQNIKDRFLQKQDTKEIAFLDGTTKKITWKDKKDWIVWKYNKYYQFRIVKNLGTLAEGYVAALFDESTPYLYYSIKKGISHREEVNWEKVGEKEKHIGALYHTYIAQVDSLTGILQEDIHFKDKNDRDVFLGVKTARTASTGSYASVVSLAEAILEAYEKLNSPDTKKIEGNLQEALKGVIQKISEGSLKIGAVFQKSLLQIDEYAQGSEKNV